MAAVASPETSTTASTRQRAAASARAGDRAGRWPDRFGTYGNIYCDPHLLASDPASHSSPTTVADDGVAVGSSSGGGGVCGRGDDSKGAGRVRRIPHSINVGNRNASEGGCRWLQWWWWRWWLYRRRTRPSEVSIEAARSAVYSVNWRLMITSSSAAKTTLATEVEEGGRGELRELGDNNGNKEKFYGGGEESADDGGGDAGGEEEQEVDNENDDDDDDDDVDEGRPIANRRPLLSPKLFSSDDASCDPTATTVPRSSPARRLLPSRGTEVGKEEAVVAARLAEGALHAYRDLTLDKATELHYALHHWTQRWADPLLLRLEAGPGLWWWSDARGGGGSGGDRHNHLPPHIKAGKKVGQIQAALARRCMVIGELQQHLWRVN